MLEFVASVETKLKRYPIGSDALAPEDLQKIQKGTTLVPSVMAVKTCGHTLWSLDDGNLWWAFDAHWHPSVMEKPSNDSSWIDGRCIDLVKKFEGFRGEAYKDSVGVWTIGYGETSIDGRPVRSDDRMTEPEAAKRLEQGLKRYGDEARALVKVPVTRAISGAITSFCWNLGVSAFRSSTLLRKLNAGDYLGAAGEFQRWVYAGNVVLEGLVTRRATEAKLFLEDGVPSKAADLSKAFTHHDMNAQVSKYFKWGEVWQWQKERVTDDPAVLKRIETLATELDKLREKFGPIQVTSFYRSPAVNRACGGVEGSRHTLGDAVDCYPLQHDPVAFESYCDSNWKGGVGLGISSGSGFVHLDLGERRRWAYGA